MGRGCEQLTPPFQGQELKALSQDTVQDSPVTAVVQGAGGRGLGLPGAASVAAGSLCRPVAVAAPRGHSWPSLRASSHEDKRPEGMRALEGRACQLVPRRLGDARRGERRDEGKNEPWVPPRVSTLTSGCLWAVGGRTCLPLFPQHLQELNIL